LKKIQLVEGMAQKQRQSEVKIELVRKS